MLDRLKLASDVLWGGLKAEWRKFTEREAERTQQDHGFVAATRAQSTNLVGLFIGLMIAAIVAVQVFIPVVIDAITTLDENNTSNTTFTVLNLLPLFAALLLLIALASPLMRRI